ncbi:phosphatidylglycerol specific phospholipase [Paecilomyces variotii No. 5]|uniref:Phosphatidylglycerol specific phospholipase n=1 Tax=Byssochlamys spectabilis (strain No. 5 / NBRC 109023) TaxID=1356009 RepID=V5FXC6_BYSSN|nr:phosphatidylglycerol specific phospholipase [Paecilomyces variotii No. 5]
MKSTLAVTAISALAAVGSAAPQKRGAAWDQVKGNIKHVVYLMMENHSFDNIAGYWDFHPGIDNLVNTQYCNEYTNPNWTVWNEPLEVCAGPYESEVPLTDPDHNFAGTSYEIYRTWNPTKDDVPNMNGFIERQSEKYSQTPGEASFVIKAYDSKKTQTLIEIAQNFAFFDSYHAEHPGPTNPNRQFATSGSTCGFVDNGDWQASGWFNNVTGTTCAVSIFEALSNKNISWKNYYETDIIDSYMYKWVQDNAMDRLVHADQFTRDLEEGTLPEFSYINPECCTIDSMHPTSNMAAGEQLIKHVYDAVRNSKYWDNVLIVINFDEHGGFADHVPPPVNIPAPEDGLTFTGVSDGHNVTYDFTRLGVRVPAFLISPYIAPNTLIHDQGTMYASNSAYTHSSILHFLQELWGLEGLNNRVQWAKTFEYVFGSQKRENTPQKLSTPVWYGGSTGPQPEPYYKLNQDESYYASLS